MIDFEHVTYVYPTTGQLALRDINFQVARGEYVVILGHNGSGKSTLARHCNALLTPTVGRVFVAGHDTRDARARQAIREQVGMVFHNPDNQLIATVVEDDVAWALATRGMAADLIRERVSEALNLVGIAELRYLPPHRLSGGQRQRVALAGVLALRPACIIADEATAMLDPLSRDDVTDILHRLNTDHGLTIIQVTHLLEEAARAQRVVVMENGSIVMDGSPGSIFANLQRLRSLRLSVPEPIELTARLRAAGVRIAPDALTVEAIARELLQ